MRDGRIAVLGTGANGAGIGADLVRAGLDVTFIEQWPAHVEAMRAHGIRVVMPDETTTTPVEVLHLCEVATLRRRFDLVFVLVKAYDTRWATELIRPYLADDGFVVGLQNGMTADDIADVVGPRRTLGAVIEVSSAMFEPGVVERHVPPQDSWFALGGLEPDAAHRAPDVAKVLEESGTVEVVEDIRSAKWMKLVVNAAELVTAAIVDRPMLDAVRLPGMREFMTLAGVEALEAGLAHGRRAVPIFGLQGLDTAQPTAFVDAIIDKVYSSYALPSTTTTVHQDWLKGRHSEVDEINGLVVRLGAEHGRACPANAVIAEVAAEIEAGNATPGPHHLSRLLDASG
jgi:2-dehydropantoate 2-reductase